MIFHKDNEDGPFSTGSINVTKSPIGPFIADQVRMYNESRYLSISGYKVLDSGERAIVSLTFLNEEGTFTGNFGNPDLPPWGYYGLGDWSWTALRGETTHTYLEKPEHVTGKFSFIARIHGADAECEGEFNIQQHSDPYP
ncbi:MULTISPECIES: hypothetical protein [Pseudomonas]|uniref:hypothetical protein n=1 Tax=Pseudomonas TaxID=286 RepID=UPI0012FDCC1A|nr:MULTISPECIES: hypothetical protein [unclassified Pseudomonas]